MIKNAYWSSVMYRGSGQIVMGLEFSRQVFQKCKHIKFNEKPSRGSRVVPCGRTDRHEEAESFFEILRMRLKGSNPLTAQSAVLPTNPSQDMLHHNSHTQTLILTEHTLCI